jgi:hypothetical protein
VRTALLLAALASPCICSAAPDQSADEMLDRAISFAAAGRLDDAEQVLLEGKSAFTRDARFRIELAGVAWRKKHSALAKSYLRQALRLNPSSDYANEFLGTLYLLDGNLYAALKYWNRIPRPVLNTVAIAPPPPLRPELSARLPAVSAGQLLTGARLAQTSRNLERLRIFSEPRFDLTSANDDEYNLIVRSQAVSRPLSGVAGRLLPLLRGLPYQQINLDWLNIEHRAIILTSLWRWDPDKRRIAIRYRAPLANAAFALWTDLRDENWDLNRREIQPGVFGVRSGAIGAEVEFELGGGRRWTPGIHLSRHRFGGGGPQPALANTTLWEVRNRFDFARLRYAERRLHVDSSVAVRTGRNFSRASSRLLGIEFDSAARWFPQQRDDTYAVSARVRAGALSGRVPLDELYITAMERDNDLWLRGHAGTRHGKKGNAPMGTRFAAAQTEILRRLVTVPFLRIDAGPFLDVANVGGVPGLGSRGWLYDTGAQAVLTTLGAFRFSVIYGRDIRNGGNVLYTAVSR